MVENNVRDDSGVDGEEEPVQQRVGRAHVGRRVLAVLVEVEHAAVVQGPRDIVQLAEVVVDAVAVDGEICRVPRVGVPDAEDEEAGDEHAASKVEC